MAKLGSKWPAARRKQHSENLRRFYALRRNGVVENEACPIDGEKSKPEFSTIHKNHIINFCSQDCQDEFKANQSFTPKRDPESLDKHETIQEVKMEMIQQLSSDLSATACLKLAKFFIEKAETDN